MGDYTFKLDLSVEFHTIECCNCGNFFAVSSQLKKLWRANGEFFYCPSCGCRQSYSKPLVKELEEELERREATLKQKDEQIRFLDRQVAAQQHCAIDERHLGCEPGRRGLARVVGERIAGED